nr:sterol carrier family protein [Corynebacterium lactis]
MAPKISPADVRSALAVVAPWVEATLAERGLPLNSQVAGHNEAPEPARPRGSDQRPSRAALAKATRLSARMLAQEAPGHSVEVRVPPFVAVQCIEGPRHTRGTPPNVVETSPEIWLGLALGLLHYDDALSHIDASGTRAAEIAAHLPVARV